ncbi:tRNA (adenosine(37)-N6)-threonylcarbamoyltransferase complex dimerization subunit type 1 TsaB [Embleya scabrispora]|uniref:tRNA (adenosine(37)-N6)-threonylcarbamoyltransferase complex dimerization subunit type 1 TsaB n=1 Tax=Embleya scabrispora TaxID=159449 RepID=UPI0003750C3A|nr:tRNA (adenosine(37)-N6)-threonylcarbamoyltransferase complex dimerization subunit type 1 TsaB [Embleya scabrispora]MYS84379.1 tRNA (adenosine(37)-N6)-threonylcarbamoyltransferase complex dimerization subunit type 1 TsaB [Streptomyces sp. SID5474]
MLLLAFDTATPAVTVALHDDSGVLADSTRVDARRQGELLAPGIVDVLRAAGRTRAELTDIAVGVGPGPYTGLRVGIVTALALGDALGVPVHGVCTLDALAYAARRDGTVTGPFVAATDARRKEVYWARYDEAGARVEGPAVDRAGELAEEVRGLPAVGAGAALYASEFGDVRLPEHPDAAALAAFAVERLVGGGGLLAAEPLYLRRPDAQVPVGYKVVTPGGPGGRA